VSKGSAKKVAFISSCLPRKCGIATFLSDLIKNVSAAAGKEFEPLVVAMRSDNRTKYGEPVKFEIRQNAKGDYLYAADFINFSHVDVVSLQHEFGLFGGDAGSYLSLLLNRLKVPVITTLHTVLDNPEPDYYKSMMDVCNASYRLITMNERGVDMLRDIYHVPRNKIMLVAHGIPDLPYANSEDYKYKFGLEGRKTILTFGLLSSNKGIEVMLKAMPAIVEAEPSVLYIVLGMTHPMVQKYEGESYRFSLQRMVKDLGLEENVIFHNRFVSDEELYNFLCATDVYVTPYLSKEQLTSGTLSFAVGTGKAVVSTPYWAATELLADKRGEIVPFGDSKKTADAIIKILRSEKLFYSLRKRAYEYGRSRTWPKTGQVYWELFSQEKLPANVPSRAAISVTDVLSFELPEPSLVYLRRLTDDTGLFQHAKFTVPNRECGYCTDDNARAVVAMALYYNQYPEPEALDLLDTYLSFTLHSQNEDGAVKNFMNFDRTWRKGEPDHDALGRVLWALGTIMSNPPSLSYLTVVKNHFDNSVKLVEMLSPRGMAYSIIGMAEYLKKFPHIAEIKRLMETAAQTLAKLYEEASDTEWQWFENKLTYDNAILPYAMFVAGEVLKDDRYTDIAQKTCTFLLPNIYNGEHFSFIGCKGWYERGGERAQYDQQPIEVAPTVMMLRAAYDATGDRRYLTLQRKAFDWFLGENDLHVSVFDFMTKGCCDALTAGGVNHNQGAESILSFILSLLVVVESYAAAEKASANGNGCSEKEAGKGKAKRQGRSK